MFSYARNASQTGTLCGTVDVCSTSSLVKMYPIFHDYTSDLLGDVVESLRSPLGGLVRVQHGREPCYDLAIRPRNKPQDKSRTGGTSSLRNGYPAFQVCRLNLFLINFDA